MYVINGQTRYRSAENWRVGKFNNRSLVSTTGYRRNPGYPRLTRRFGSGFSYGTGSTPAWARSRYKYAVVILPNEIWSLHTHPPAGYTA